VASEMFVVNPESWSLPNKVMVSLTFCADNEPNTKTKVKKANNFFIVLNFNDEQNFQTAKIKKFIFAAPNDEDY
jgi:hypothetical protein